MQEPASALTLDPEQKTVAAHLARLSLELENAGTQADDSFLKRWFTARPVQPIPHSVYIWGPVGRGKSLLMDRFFEKCAIAAKRRVHFHAFMQDVHGRLDAARLRNEANDAIKSVAADIAVEARLLCLDELQIEDIADAMLVGRLFEALLENGLCIVTTGNVAPVNLYQNGLNRDLFLPFIALISERFDILSLDGPRDYRLDRFRAARCYIVAPAAEADAALDQLWLDFTGTAHGVAARLAFSGRTLLVPQMAHGAARFSFAQLCEAPLGIPDYQALALACRLLFIDHIPALTPADRNAARRFILLIDTLYEARTRLIASAAVSPGEIYPAGDHSDAFRRTASRLEEMQSATWWADSPAK